MIQRLLLSLFLAMMTGLACAQATTVTLTPEDCTATRFCDNVDGQGTTLYANPNGSGVVELFMADGTTYLGGGAVGLSVTNYPVYRQPGNDKVIYVTATWYTWTTRGSGSGRGGYAPRQHWSLTSGSLLVLP